MKKITFFARNAFLAGLVMVASTTVAQIELKV